MQKDSSRLRRISEQVKRELATLFALTVKDPRVRFVTINAVEVSPDLSLAKVYFTAMNLQGEQQELEKTVNSLAGFLRRELGRSLHLRVIPQLRFYYDDSIEQGAHLSSLIDAAVAEDLARSAGSAESATRQGDKADNE